MNTTPLRRSTHIHKALGHPARIRITAMLRGGELCVCQMTAVLGLATSTVSAHLAELRRAGLVTERKEQRWVHYHLAEDEETAGLLTTLWRGVTRDPVIKEDARVLRKLRRIPVETLCAVELDLRQLAIARRKPTTAGSTS